MTVTDENFDSVISGGTVVIYFWSANCPFCSLMGPGIMDVTKRYGATLYKGQNIENARTGERLKINLLPALVMFRDGKEVGRLLGGRRYQEIEEFFQQGWQPTIAETMAAPQLNVPV